MNYKMNEIRLVDRDKKIIKEIDRWRVCQGRHIKELAGFEGQRACDRRLRKLIEAGYVKREKILYGVAGIYRITAKAKKLMKEQLPNAHRKIRIEQLTHDIAVLDTAIFLGQKQGIPFEDITTEIELHRQDGFGVRKHRPDFVFTQNGKTVCVEVELTLKAKHRLDKNIKDNFLVYDRQIWVVPSLGTKIAKILTTSKAEYPNIELIELSKIQKEKEGEKNNHE